MAIQNITAKYKKLLVRMVLRTTRETQSHFYFIIGNLYTLKSNNKSKILTNMIHPGKTNLMIEGVYSDNTGLFIHIKIDIEICLVIIGLKIEYCFACCV